MGTQFKMAFSQLAEVIGFSISLVSLLIAQGYC